MGTYQPVREIDHRESLPDLVRQLADQFSNLIRMEIRLAKAETQEGVKKMAVSGVLAWLAVRFATLCFLFLVAGIALALVQAAEMTWYAAAFTTAAICLGVMLLCLGLALWRLKKGEPHLG